MRRTLTQQKLLTLSEYCSTGRIVKNQIRHHRTGRNNYQRLKHDTTITSNVAPLAHAASKHLLLRSQQSFNKTSCLASPKMRGKLLTLFCLGYRLSKHKMTICSKNWGEWPNGPPWLCLWIKTLIFCNRLCSAIKQNVWIDLP